MAYRFLNEDPWERLRKIRAAAPNICLQVSKPCCRSIYSVLTPLPLLSTLRHLSASDVLSRRRQFDISFVQANPLVVACSEERSIVDWFAADAADVLRSALYLGSSCHHSFLVACLSRLLVRVLFFPSTSRVVTITQTCAMLHFQLQLYLRVICSARRCSSAARTPSATPPTRTTW